MKHTPYGKRQTSRTEPVNGKLSILGSELDPTQSFWYERLINTQKHAWLSFRPVNLFLNFGRSAARNPCSYVAALVLYGTQGSVRGLHRWEYRWLLLSPKFNAKQHRRRERWRSEILTVFSQGVLKNASN